MNLLGDRIRRAVEGILGNESLAEGLETDAAQTLLNWGTSLAESVAAETGDLDDPSAELAMGPRLKATRKLMRAAGQWVAGRTLLSEVDRAFYWNKIMENAAVLYGGRFSLPSPEQAAQLDQVENPPELLRKLRDLFETPTGGNNA